MLWHRIRGLWNAYHAVLAVILTLVFWFYLAIVFFVFRDRVDVQDVSAIHPVQSRCSRRAGDRRDPRARDRGDDACGRFCGRPHSGSQADRIYWRDDPCCDVGCRGSTRVPGPEAGAGIRFLALRLCRLSDLPSFSAEASWPTIFSRRQHEQRTLLIGPVDKAREIAKWIEETAAFGFGMSGSVTDSER